MDRSEPLLAAQRATAMFVSPSGEAHNALRKIFQTRSNWTLYSAFNCEEAIQVLRRQPIPVVICERGSGNCDWRFLLERTATMASPPRVILATQEANDGAWSEVLQRGGYDLLAIPWESRRVFRVVCLAWRSWTIASRTMPAPANLVTAAMA